MYLLPVSFNLKPDIQFQISIFCNLFSEFWCLSYKFPQSGKIVIAEFRKKIQKPRKWRHKTWNSKFWMLNSQLLNVKQHTNHAVWLFLIFFLVPTIFYLLPSSYHLKIWYLFSKIWQITIYIQFYNFRHFFCAHFKTPLIFI